MKFDIVDGLKSEEIIGMYENEVVEGLENEIYLTRCDCWYAKLNEPVPTQYLPEYNMYAFNFYCKQVHDETPDYQSCVYMCNSRYQHWQHYDPGCICRSQGGNWIFEENGGYTQCAADWN